ncbi:MAG TPA: discoidin domain-containing protein, partial [Prosthecobacter sp.]
VDQGIALFYVGNTGVLTNRKGSNGRPAVASTNDVVVEWHDISERGGDNILRAFSSSPDHAPKRINWPEAAKGGSPRAGRAVLDFRPRDGNPCALVLDDTGKESSNMPFAPGDVTGGDAGLTMVVVFQADASKLPTRVCTLKDDDRTSVSIRVDEKKNIVAEIKSPGGSPTITSTSVDGTIASLVFLTWNSKTNAVEMRAKDSFGKSYTSSGVKATAPVQALTSFEIGRGEGSLPDLFSGFLAEAFVYSIALKPDQIQQIDGRVRDYYFVPAPPAPLKQRIKSKKPWIEPRNTWRLTASHKKEEASKTVDDNTASRWSTSAAMKGGEWFMVELPSETDIAGVVIDSQGNYQDYARKYKIEVSADGKGWTTAAEGNGSALVEAGFSKPQRGRFVRITQLGTSGSLWGINELVLLKP